MDLGINTSSGFTRRSLLSAGATAGAAALLGVRPWAAAAASSGYLTRSAYAGLEGARFTVETGADPVVLRLEAVSDVAGAATRRGLAGSDDAFALRFSGPIDTPLDSGIHTLHHPWLGKVELFASPVDDPAADRTYEIVVDRSVGAPAAQAEAPKAPEAPRAAPTPQPEPGPEAAPEKPAPHPAVVRRAKLTRAGRWARCELVLRSGVDAERVRCRLERKGKQLASAGKAVNDGRAVVRLEGVRPLAPGTYTLVVTAIAAGGKATTERKRVTLG
jgi:hypothetical protein